MPTTNAGFVVTSATALVGTAVTAAPAVLVLNDDASANEAVQGGGGTRMDKAAFNLATAGYAKNAGVNLALTGTTAITIDLTALAAATGVVVGGDSSFAQFNQLILINTGAVDLSVTPGAANPARLPITGTTPGYTVPAGSRLVLESVAGQAVDATHKTLAVTPTAGGSLNVAIGGA